MRNEIGTQNSASPPLPSTSAEQHCNKGKENTKYIPNHMSKKVPSLRALSDTRIEGEIRGNDPKGACIIIEPTLTKAKHDNNNEIEKEKEEKSHTETQTQEQEQESEEKSDNEYRIWGWKLRIPLPVLLPLLTFLSISIISFSVFFPCSKARETVLEDTALVGRKEILDHARLFRTAFLSRVVSDFTRIVRNTMVTTSLLWQHIPLDTVLDENFTISENLDLCEDIFKPISMSYRHFTTVTFLVQQGDIEKMFYVHVLPDGKTYAMGILDTTKSDKQFTFDYEAQDDGGMYLNEWNLSMSKAVPGKEVSFDQIPLWNAVKGSSNETKSVWTITNSFILSEVDSTIISYSKKIIIPKNKNNINSIQLESNDDDDDTHVCNNENCANDLTDASTKKSESEKDGNMVGFVSTILTYNKMQELFGSMPVTKNGFSFVTDGSPELKMIASRNIDVFYKKAELERISSFVHPSPAVQDIAQTFSSKVLPGHATISSDEPTVGEFSMFNNTTSVDYEMIPLGEPGHHWWLFVVTPQEDFFEETLTKFAQTEHNISYTLFKMSGYAFIVIVLCVIISINLSSNIRRIAKEIENCANLRTDTPQLKMNTMFREIAEISDRTSRLKVTLESYGRYVPMPVINMGMMGSEVPKLGVAPHYATIMFIDVANFTCLSEIFSDKMLEVLNVMFDEFSKILIDHGAVIDKYIGDAIMAFWNVPNPIPKSEEAAVRSAVTIMNRLERLNDEVFYPKLNTRMRVRVGINSGTVFAGNVGVPQRINYTVLGKNVNTAAHLEPFNKELGTRVLVTSAVRDACKSCDDICFRCLGKVCLKGMSEEIVIHQIMGDSSYVASQYKDTGIVTRYKSIDKKLLTLFGRIDNEKEDDDDDDKDYNEQSQEIEELKKDYQSYLEEHKDDIAVKYFYEKMFNK